MLPNLETRLLKSICMILTWVTTEFLNERLSIVNNDLSFCVLSRYLSKHDYNTCTATGEERIN